MPAIARSARFFAVLALLVLIPGLASASTKKHSFEIGILESFSRYDTQYAIGNDWYQTIEAGFNFTAKHALEVSFAAYSTNPKEGAGFPITVNNLRLGYVYNKPFREKFVSLFKFGVGQQNIDPAAHPGGNEQLEDRDRNFLWYAGGGVKYFFTDWIGIRFDGSIDLVYTKSGISAGDVQGTANIGLIFSIGGKDPQ